MSNPVFKFSVLTPILLSVFGCTSKVESVQPIAFASNGFDFALAPYDEDPGELFLSVILEVKLGLTGAFLLSQAESRISRIVIGEECGLKISGIDTFVAPKGNTLELHVNVPYLQQRCTVTASPNVICEDTWIKLPFGIKTKGPPNCREFLKNETIKSQIFSGKDEFVVNFDTDNDLRKFRVDSPPVPFQGDASSLAFFTEILNREVIGIFQIIETNPSSFLAGSKLSGISKNFNLDGIYIHKNSKYATEYGQVVVKFEGKIPRGDYLVIQKYYYNGSDK